MILTDPPTPTRAQDDLVKTGMLQDAILKSANYTSIATDRHGVIQVFNVGAERMLGYRAEDVIDKVTPAEISDPAELVTRAAALSRELGTPIAPGFDALVFKASRGIEDVYELNFVRQDGSRLPAVVSVSALRDGQGELIGYLLMGTDNSARKRVELDQLNLQQRLRDQQFYTRSLIESVIDALVTIDPAGTITDVNRQAEAITGCTREELIGTPFRDYFTEPARATECIDQVLLHKTVTDYELTARRKDDHQTVLSCNATTFLDRDQTLAGVITAARDVTEAKRLEKLLRDTHSAMETAKVAAERANLAKSDFLSSMSHELRSPLNAILGFAQLIESGTPAPTSGQAESVEQILQAGWYLLELINEILDLALIESGRIPLSPEPVSLTELLAECQAMSEPQAQASGIRLSFECSESPLHVRADRTRLKQVVLNLLSNAIKYNRAGGSVEVRVDAGDGQRTRVSFHDNGHGLSQEKLAQLFQPFNRLGQEKGTEQGTGIGLVVCKQLVGLMDGRIGVESEEGVGSVFWIEMATTHATHLDAGTIKVAGCGSADRHDPAHDLGAVLCIEDNPANLMLVRKLLARRPELQLLSAGDARLGLELARERLPQVILMDINLPGMSGLTALRILAADPRTAHIPVIALSANAMPRDVARGMEAGFFRYLTKPIKVNEFMDTLDEALVLARARAGSSDTDAQMVTA